MPSDTRCADEWEVVGVAFLHPDVCIKEGSVAAKRSGVVALSVKFHLAFEAVDYILFLCNNLTSAAGSIVVELMEHHCHIWWGSSALSVTGFFDTSNGIRFILSLCIIIDITHD